MSAAAALRGWTSAASVNSLAERPSQQEAIVRSLIGRGVRLHTIELGNINAHLPGLFAAWASAESVERELDQALADMAAMEQRHEQDLQQRREVLSGLLIAIEEGPSSCSGSQRRASKWWSIAINDRSW
jgi:hypothetical protein